MSFLDELINNKSRLKRTDTTITLPDGRKVLESHGTVTALPSASHGFIVDTKPDDVPAKVTDNVFLGSQDCTELCVLRTYRIARVLSIGVEVDRHPGIVYKYVPCLDLPETDIVDVIKLHCFDFIRRTESRNENVLVHCNAGVSRSAAVVIGYLMLVDKLDYDLAYGTVKKVRGCAKPNAGFEKQLKRMTYCRAP